MKNSFNCYKLLIIIILTIKIKFNQQFFYIKIKMIYYLSQLRNI